MSGFFKKALGVFLEFENDQPVLNKDSASTPHKPVNASQGNNPAAFSQADIDKFEKHFEDLFDKSNLPGPDYFEFWKMMETLESHIPDEKTRMSAVYASLSIQGLTKDRIIQSADHYKRIVQKDREEFLKVVQSKKHKEVDGRNQEVVTLENKMNQHSEMIQKLTKEISEMQTRIVALKHELLDEERKLAQNHNSYQVACEAMISKINNDIIKINSSL